MHLTQTQSALDALINRFIQRQYLVLEAMKELRPDIVMRVSQQGDPRERARLNQELARRPAEGDWGNDKEWRYFLHGGGCRLTHKFTHERIEWDVGSLQRFDRFWFVNYLEWLLETDTTDDVVASLRVGIKEQLESWTETKPSFGPLRDVVFSLLEKLRELGILVGHEQYYIKVPDNLESLRIPE